MKFWSKKAESIRKEILERAWSETSRISRAHCVHVTELFSQGSAP